MAKTAIFDQRLMGEFIPPIEGTFTQRLPREIILPPEKAFTLLLCDLEDQIQAAAEAMYDGIALTSYDIERYLGQKHSIEELASLLNKYQISISEIFCMVGLGWQYEGEGRIKAFAETRDIFSYTSLLGCNVVEIALPPHEGNISLATRDFTEICKMAEDYGLSVALEFFGFGTKIKDLKASRMVVEEPTNGGINLDTFQFYKGGSTLEELKDFPVEKILTVHITDCYDRPPPEQEAAPIKETLDILKSNGYRILRNKGYRGDSTQEELEDFPVEKILWGVPRECWNRPIPGEGDAPVKEIIDILKNKGYSGYYTLELLTYGLYGKDPGEVARMGKKVLQGLLGEVN